MDTSVIVIGSYINACSIVLSLQDVGYDGEIYVIEANEDRVACMADVLLKNVIVIKKKLDEPEQIIGLINWHISEECKKIILMIEEEFIEPIRLGIRHNVLKNAISYTGSNLDNEFIFDVNCNNKLNKVLN